MIQKIKNTAFFLFVLILAGSFKKNAADATLIIQFRAYVHGVPLQLNKKYLNAFGESFEISRFRFYTGKIAPIYSDGRFKSKISSKYHLIDFSDSSSTRIELPVMAGLCEGIRFQLGVDSLDQNRGAQTGALDPVRGMFWTWNSGYVNLKIEGYSAASPQPAHVIEYHIGGYHYADNTVWKIKMNSTNDESFRMSKENKIILEVGIDLEYLFDGPFPLHIKDNSTCTMPGKMARKISENFIGSFTGLTISPNP